MAIIFGWFQNRTILSLIQKYCISWFTCLVRKENFIKKKRKLWKKICEKKNHENNCENMQLYLFWKMMAASSAKSKCKIKQVWNIFSHLRKRESSLSMFKEIKQIIYSIGKIVSLLKNGILLPKLFWPTLRTREQNCSSDREKLLKFKAEGREFAKLLESLEQFIQTVKGQNNFLVT